MTPKPNWPNWSGDTAFIIASGPSLKKQDVEMIRGRGRVIAIKKCVELAPWADVVYGCDGPWWRSVQGLMKFQGLKLAYEPTICDSEYGIRRVEIPDKQANRFLFDEVGKIGSGGNSGFQALNLAAQFGATRIILLGFDVQGESGGHWYGRNNWMQANNPDQYCYQRWQNAFRIAAPDLVARGIDVINASRNSALTCFRRLAIASAIDLAKEAA
jgi:hypothetical protein